MLHMSEILSKYWFKFFLCFSYICFFYKEKRKKYKINISVIFWFFNNFKRNTVHNPYPRILMGHKELPINALIVELIFWLNYFVKFLTLLYFLKTVFSSIFKVHPFVWVAYRINLLRHINANLMNGYLITFKFTSFLKMTEYVAV